MRAMLAPLAPMVLTMQLVGGGAAAEERCKFSWESPKGVAKYTQQLMMDVGDIPGHKIGAYELHRSNPEFKLPCESTKVVEQWAHGFRDIADRNGRAWGYEVLTLDTGDKIYGQWSGTVQNEVVADGTSKTTYEGTEAWTGGTGRYQGVRGILRAHVLIEYEAGAPGAANVKTNQVKADGEYWFEN
jgi:hypothetical protein